MAVIASAHTPFLAVESRRGVSAPCGKSLDRTLAQRNAGGDVNKARNHTQPSLLTLAAIMTRDSNLTFGGGSATAEAIRRSLAKRGWMSDEEHQRLFAVSRLTPGTNLLAYCTAVGLTTRGPYGAFIALIAASVPSSVMCVIATILYERLAASPTLALVVLIGMTAAVLLLCSSAWHLASPLLLKASTRRRALGIAIIAAAMSLVGLSPIVVLLGTAAFGAVWTQTT